MRIVVDTNIGFSAMLYTNSRISTILLHPKKKYNFYSTETLLLEIREHSEKLKHISGYSDEEFEKVFELFARQIRFINIKLIPKQIYLDTLKLTRDVDIDDTAFVALAEHIKGKLWTGDKALIRGMRLKKWDKFIETNTLFETLKMKL